MNTIGLLLVLGLAFYALKQKSQKTRNMLLVVSALLGFCMFSAEGFMVTPNGTCVEATIAVSAASVTEDAALCLAVTDLDDGTACGLVTKTGDNQAQACTYADPTGAVGLAATDLPLLFPSCGVGTKVKAGGTLTDMCEESSTIGRVTWENICGDGAECDGSIELLGANALAEDKSNQCGATFQGTWASTCKCTDDDKTWTSSGTSNGCTAE